MDALFLEITVQSTHNQRKDNGMKKKMFVLALLAGITMFSMHGAEAKKAEDSAGTPSYAVKAYYTSMAKADFAAAKKYLAYKVS